MLSVLKKIHLLVPTILVSCETVHYQRSALNTKSSSNNISIHQQLNIHISLLVNSAKAAALSPMEENLDPPREVDGGAEVY